MTYRDPLTRIEYPEMLLRCHKCSCLWWAPYEYGEGPFDDLVPVCLYEEDYYCKGCGGEGLAEEEVEQQ